MTISTILFDLDGTLVDSAIEVGAVLNSMRHERGYSTIEGSQFRKLISYGAAGLVKCALGSSEEDQQGLVDEFRTKYSTLKTPKASIYPTVVETLSTLKKRGYALGVCTNKPQNLCNNVLRDTQLDCFFSCVIAGSPSLKPKPHHAPIHLAISRMGAEISTTILIGDSSADQRAAQSAGIPFIFFASGYNDAVFEEQALASIHTMNELLDLGLFDEAQSRFQS